MQLTGERPVRADPSMCTIGELERVHKAFPSRQIPSFFDRCVSMHGGGRDHSMQEENP
jgi:hypothetical protein